MIVHATSPGLPHRACCPGCTMMSNFCRAWRLLGSGRTRRNPRLAAPWICARRASQEPRRKGAQSMRVPSPAPVRPGHTWHRRFPRHMCRLIGCGAGPAAAKQASLQDTVHVHHRGAVTLKGLPQPIPGEPPLLCPASHAGLTCRPELHCSWPPNGWLFGFRLYSAQRVTTGQLTAAHAVFSLTTQQLAARTFPAGLPGGKGKLVGMPLGAVCCVQILSADSLT